MMRIAIGRRQLVVRLEHAAGRTAEDNYPMAVNASDAELARLSNLQLSGVDRARWETAAVLYGAARLRSA
jgi:hypothetical protein